MTDPRTQAARRLNGRYDVRVLEPSPPAVEEPPFFSDDPVAGGEILPVARQGCRTWAEICSGESDAELSAWCAERWLGPWKRLVPLPASFPGARQALHALAEHVVAPARHQANGKIGLRYTRGGFGTPFFGADRQIRVEGAVLVIEDEVIGRRQAAITTLGEAAALVGVAAAASTGVFTPTTEFDPDRPLTVDPMCSRALGDWFGFCASVLEQVRAEATDASRVQLWPEHFDLAVDLGDEGLGRRANYGGSPGDEDHPEPYLYVGPWVAQQGGAWNEAFGASLSYTAIVEAPDQRETALAFLRTRRGLLERDADR